MFEFIFSNQQLSLVTHRVEIFKGINSKAELLDALSSALHFPDYFEHNWDSLEECINDLSWLPPGDIMLVHQDLPLEKDVDALSIYLSILTNAIENWKSNGSNLIFNTSNGQNSTIENISLKKRIFLVVFPLDVKKEIEDILLNKYFQNSKLEK